MTKVLNNPQRINRVPNFPAYNYYLKRNYGFVFSDNIEDWMRDKGKTTQVEFDKKRAGRKKNKKQ